MYKKLLRRKVDRSSGLVFRPFSMAFWLSVALLGFVSAIPLLPISNASPAPAFVRIVEGAAVDSTPQTAGDTATDSASEKLECSTADEPGAAKSQER